MSVYAMVVEIGPSRFGETRSLWSELGNHLAVESILERKTKARMLVDDADHPCAAMTWTGHRIYLTGNIGVADFGSVITAGHYIVYPKPNSLKDAETLFSGFSTSKRERIYYTVDPSSRFWVFKLPEGYRIETITKDTLSYRLHNTDLVESEMVSERESISDFLDNSFGFVAIQEDEIVCWCMSEYNIGNRCEVGIETVPKHRRMGLASAVAGALFEHALVSGLNRVGWHCWADNFASIATAEGLGLRLTDRYPVLTVDANFGRG